MKHKLCKQDKELLDNRIVLISSITFLYAILLVFIQKMAESSLTVNGALAFIQIVRWVALAGALICAAWSAYKEKRSFFIYCGICIYIFLSTTILLYCGRHGKAYYINYLAIGLAFVMTQVYYVLKAKCKFEKKLVRTLFLAVCIILTVLIAALCIWQQF